MKVMAAILKPAGPAGRSVACSAEIREHSG
jgi:hypothetical protein